MRNVSRLDIRQRNNYTWEKNRYQKSEYPSTIEILREMQEPYEAMVQLLMTIPCVKEISALLLAEFTDDLSAFPTSEYFCSWLGICPENNKFAGKAHGCSTPKVNKWARATLTEIAHGLGLSKGNPFRERFQVFKER